MQGATVLPCGARCQRVPTFCRCENDAGCEFRVPPALPFREALPVPLLRKRVAAEYRCGRIILWVDALPMPGRR